MNGKKTQTQKVCEDAVPDDWRNKNPFEDSLKIHEEHGPWSEHGVKITTTSLVTSGSLRSSVGRKSLAEKFYVKAEEDYEEERGTWLVMYDFKGLKANSKFWTNIKRVIERDGRGSLIQYSVFTTPSLRSAVTVFKLAKHYGGEAILYKAEERDINLG